MAQLKVFYFEADGAWLCAIGKSPASEEDLGVIFSEPLNSESEAKDIAEHAGNNLELQVEKLNVALANTPWSQSDQKPN